LKLVIDDMSCEIYRIPYEVQVLIFRTLDIKDWATVQSVCKEFWTVCQSDMVTQEVLTLENAARTWPNLIFPAKTPREHQDLLMRYAKQKMVKECICLNPFKNNNTPPYLLWSFKANIESGVQVYRHFLDEISGPTQNFLHSYQNIRRLLLNHLHTIFYTKNDILRQSLKNNDKSLHTDLRVQIKKNIDYSSSILTPVINPAWIKRV